MRSRFTPKSVASLQPMIEGHVGDLLTDLTNARTPDLANQLAWPLPLMVMCSVFGLPADERWHVAALYRTVMQRSPETVTVPPRALEAAGEMRDYFVSQARERRRRPRDDLMTQIALARPDGEALPDAKLAGLCFVLFSAGIDTVTSLLGSAALPGRRDDR